MLDGIGQLVMVEGFEKVAVNSTLTLSVIMTFFFTLKSTFQKKGLTLSRQPGELLNGV